MCRWVPSTPAALYDVCRRSVLLPIEVYNGLPAVVIDQKDENVVNPSFGRPNIAVGHRLQNSRMTPAASSNKKAGAPPTRSTGRDDHVNSGFRVAALTTCWHSSSHQLMKTNGNRRRRLLEAKSSRATNYETIHCAAMRPSTMIASAAAITRMHVLRRGSRSPASGIRYSFFNLKSEIIATAETK